MFTFITMCFGVFGDRQGVFQSLDAVVVVRYMQGARGGTEYVEHLKNQLRRQTPYPFYLCTDDSDGDLQPLVTDRTRTLLHTPDETLPSTWGDSPAHRRWKLALTMDLFGCLLSAYSMFSSKVVVYMEDDASIKPRFAQAVSDFILSEDRIRWGWLGTGPVCMLVKRSEIPRMYALSEKRWMHDPVDWIIIDTMKPFKKVDIVSHTGNASTAHWKKKRKKKT